MNSATSTNSASQASITSQTSTSISTSLNSLGWTFLKEAQYSNSEFTKCTLSQAEEKVCIELLSLYSKIQNVQSPQETLKNILVNYCSENNIAMERLQAEKIIKTALLSATSFGPISILLQDAEIEEITACNINTQIRVFIKNKGWQSTPILITSEEFAIDVINKMARGLGRRVTYQHPRLNASLPDGSRLHACISPVVRHFEFTIRKFKEKPYSLEELVELKTISKQASEFLVLCINADLNGVIAGNTGSGKTTTLNALCANWPIDERIILIEETPEINIPHKHKVSLVCVPEIEISMQDLVHDSLRMRPDRVVMGEVRTQSEVESIFDSLLAGQAKGTWTTFHANSAQEALNRFQSLGIALQDLNSIDVVVIQRRITRFKGSKKEELRKVTEIATIENEKPTVLFKLNEIDELEKTSEYKNKKLKIFQKLKTTHGREI